MWKIRLDLAPEKVLTRVLTLEETRKLLRQAKRELGRLPSKPSRTTNSKFLALRNLAMVELLFATGIRIGELTSLRTLDFRYDEKTFTICGKGAKQRLAILPDKHSLQTINSYFVHRVLIATDHDVLFINSLKGPLSTQGAANIISRLAHAAGIKQRVTPHMLRHTVATLLLRSGADIRVVQEFLGHATISTTQRYTHVSTEHLVYELQEHHPNNIHPDRH